MIEIGIVGAKNSGKTTLIEQLIKTFASRGIRTATIKHTSHNHQFDTPGKDSWRHRQAGSVATLVLSGTEAALFFEPTASLLNRVCEQFGADCQICLVEGDKRSDRPHILLTRHTEKIDAAFSPAVIATYGPKAAITAERHFELDQIDHLADFLIARFDIIPLGTL